MTDSYPYMLNYGKIAQILDKIRKAAEPQKFTQSYLSTLGFGSTNDRAFIPLFKKLGFLNEDGSPTEFYKDLRDVNKYRFALGNQIKTLYSDIFAINTEIQNAPESEIKAAMSRVTGKDEASVNRYYSTFKTLTDIAEFQPEVIEEKKEEQETPPKKQVETKISAKENVLPLNTKINPDFHYNIQIHLPATTDISVYNAIFKSIKENLM